MHAAHLIPDLALARVVTGGGPYTPGDDLSLAFATPTISRLVAHDTDVRAKCVPLEGALVPEMISVVIIHSTAPYASGDILTLSFVDPRVARVQRTAERQGSSAVLRAPSEQIAFDDLAVTVSAEMVPLARATAEAPREDCDARTEPRHDRPAAAAPSDDGTAEPIRSNVETEQTLSIARHHSGARAITLDGRTPEPSSDVIANRQTSPQERSAADTLPDEQHAMQTPSDQRRRIAQTRPEEPDERRSVYPPTPDQFSATGRVTEQNAKQGIDPVISQPFDGVRKTAQLRAGERMTLQENDVVAPDAMRNAIVAQPDGEDRPSHDTAELRAAIADAATNRGRAQRALAPPSELVTVRLEWAPERLRRFVQVVDKLFTIDRLGWYRHSLAMRLLIPDEITCGDALANVEAMRHLQALRAAAVESLGKPLLAACMPGFSISSEWLETLESSREARAIAGLREALLPYSGDHANAIDPPADAALCTIGTIARRELLADNATSVEAFLPLLIPTKAHDAELGVRLAEYRRLLVELFTQTARAGELVRLNQMAQPNHSLDDRLWQLVGAAAEAFGGFAHA